jgi:hypothetical protein
MRTLVLCTVLSLLTRAADAQIVNIESARMQSDTTGWKGSAAAGFTLTQNTQKVYDFNAGAHIQFKDKKNLYLLLGSSEFLKGDGSSLINNSFVHFRYNRKFTPHMRWEWFTQLQNNAVTGIELRFLAGTGPRFKLTESHKFRSYLGLAVMYEYEKDKAALAGQESIYHRDARGNAYFSLSWKPEESAELISTTFCQPLLDNWNDFRLLEQMSFRIKPGKHFLAHFDFQYLYDQFPAPGRPKTNYKIDTGIGFEF